MAEYEGHTIWINTRGYPCITLNKKMVRLHVYVWEKSNGKRPIDMHIHHKDHDKLNFNLDNLELLSVTDHRRHHEGWLKTNGEWTHKRCSYCKEFFVLEEFGQRSYGGLYDRCHKCRNIYARERYAKKRLLRSLSNA